MRAVGDSLIQRTFDEDSGVILVFGGGFWSITDIERHYAALRDMIAGLRAQGRPVRLLSDVTQGQRQASWVEDYILEQMRQTFAPGDRIALLAGSTEDEAHLRDRGTSADVVPFTSRDAAMAWLQEPDGGADRD
jgi:hypothetical protein